MDEKIKTWPLRFPAEEKKNPNMEKALLQHDVKATKRMISRNFEKAWSFFIRAFV